MINGFKTIDWLAVWQCLICHLSTAEDKHQPRNDSGGTSGSMGG